MKTKITLFVLILLFSCSGNLFANCINYTCKNVTINEIVQGVRDTLIDIQEDKAPLTCEAKSYLVLDLHSSKLHEIKALLKVAQEFKLPVDFTFEESEQKCKISSVLIRSS